MLIQAWQLWGCVLYVMMTYCSVVFRPVEVQIASLKPKLNTAIFHYGFTSWRYRRDSKAIFSSESRLIDDRWREKVFSLGDRYVCSVSFR